MTEKGRRDHSSRGSSVEAWSCPRHVAEAVLPKFGDGGAAMAEAQPGDTRAIPRREGRIDSSVGTVPVALACPQACRTASLIGESAV